MVDFLKLFPFVPGRTRPSTHATLCVIQATKIVNFESLKSAGHESSPEEFEVRTRSGESEWAQKTISGELVAR
jgi:hypothetical protein